MTMIQIDDLSKPAVLAALYNASRPQGMGFMHYDPAPMTVEEATDLLEQTTYFDYLKGRVMKVDLSNAAQFDPWGYDRDNGEGAAQIDTLRKAGAPETEEIREAHEAGRSEALREARQLIQKTTSTRVEGGVQMMELGGADVAHVLEPALDRAEEGC